MILVQNREQTLEVLFEVDPTTGAMKELLREADDAWVNLDGEMPKWRRDGKSFLWSTERRRGWQLELRNRDGSLVRVLTPVELNYRHLLGVEDSAGVAWIAAGEDPTQTHLYRVSLNKETPPEQLTHEPGVHGAILSEESGVSVRGSQSLTSESKQVVYRRDGSVAGELKSVAEKSTLEPNVELVTVGTDRQFHAAIIRPHDFQMGKRYPVIVSVYAGPHAQTVVASRGYYLIDGWLAEPGFRRGLDRRARHAGAAVTGSAPSKASSSSVPLDDQVQGLQVLGAKFPELDLARVGIYGWSFGGYFSAMRRDATARRVQGRRRRSAGHRLARLRHALHRALPRCADHRIRVAYQVSSVLDVAHDLRRPLLVDPRHGGRQRLLPAQH